jgi:hypothetical protein
MQIEKKLRHVSTPRLQAVFHSTITIAAGVTSCRDVQYVTNTQRATNTWLKFFCLHITIFGQAGIIRRPPGRLADLGGLARC